MRVISMWQPWATLWASGEKKIETRKWEFPWPLPCVIGIHAAKIWNGRLKAFADNEFCTDSLSRLGFRIWPKATLAFGAIIGLVRVVEHINTALLHPGPAQSPFIKMMTRREKCFGDFTPGRYAWIADRFYLLTTPVPMDGLRNFWQWVPNEEAARVEQQWLDELPAVV
jgi:hypothetical protein